MYHGQPWFDAHGQQGVATKKRNPKKKNRLPYHAKHLMSLPIMGQKAGTICPHALAKHEVIVRQDGTFNERGLPYGREVTVSYAAACQVKHKSTTVNPQHRDTYRRTWR